MAQADDIARFEFDPLAVGPEEDVACVAARRARHRVERAEFGEDLVERDGHTPCIIFDDEVC